MTSNAGMAELFFPLMLMLASAHSQDAPSSHDQSWRYSRVNVNEVRSDRALGSRTAWSPGGQRAASLYQKVCQCSRVYRGRQLVNVRPMDTSHLQSEEDCLTRCGMNTACTSVNYCSYDRRCELFQMAFDQPPYGGSGRCIPVNGCSYYSVNMACVGYSSTVQPPPTVVTGPPTAATTGTAGTIDTTTTAMFTTPSPDPILTTTTTGGGTRSPKSCPTGQSAVYSRSPGFADPRINVPKSVKQNAASAADCQTECDNRADCLSFDYLANTRTCNFYDSVNKDPLQPESNVEHVDSFCVPGNCQGTIDRVPNKVQVTSPVVQTAISANDCINKCLSNKPCMAVSYYSNIAKDNCLLSQQSRQTDPTNFIDENSSKVDYFGLDSCASARLNAKKSLIRHREQSSLKKRADKPITKVKSASPLSKTTRAFVPNAKEYRQMVIAAQNKKNAHKKP